MNTDAPIAAIPIAWLRPLPEEYRIPVWRWILVPATTLMLKRNRGVWLSGQLQLMPDRVRFIQSRLVKSSRSLPAEWSIPLGDIAGVEMQKGMASETLEIRHSGGTVRLMSARSSDFVDRLKQAIAQKQSGAGPRPG